MEVVWFEEVWKDYVFRKMQDKKTIKRIDLPLQDATRNGYNGISKPESLRGEFGVFWGGWVA